MRSFAENEDILQKFTEEEEIKATAKAGLDSGLDQNNITIKQYVNRVIAFNLRFATDIVPCSGVGTVAAVAASAATLFRP